MAEREVLFRVHSKKTSYYSLLLDIPLLRCVVSGSALRCENHGAERSCDGLVTPQSDVTRV